ncbi:MAG: ABC transporter substrate-binding protein [Nitrospirae bacterium]|nr:ABC transporter substrate-binding protein [Nitrospirota bacterium]MBI5695090.1 ABC transporter substrate-binding protein [Nitrospirota bacterium]
MPRPMDLDASGKTGLAGGCADTGKMLKRTAIILLLFLLGCSTQARQPEYLYLRLSSDPTTLDPAFIVDTAGGAIAAKLYNGLVGFDRDAKVVPDAAESYELSKDGKTYIFHIRPGIKFTNGRELTAQDFKYSFERVLSPVTSSPRTWLFDRVAGAREFMDGKADGVSGIRALDARTLVIELAAPFGPFLGLLAMPGAYVIPREAVEAEGEGFSDRPVGTGPYTLASWEHGSRITLSANPGYLGEKPRLAGIIYRVIPEDLTAVAEFERGNLDAIGIPAPEFARYVKDPKWKGNVLSQVGMNTYYLGMNCARPPFDDPRLRQAVSYAIDKKRILATVYEGRAVAAIGPVPPVLLTMPPCCLDSYPYDPAEAKRLLSEAGHPDGLKMTIYIGAEQETLDMVEVVQQYLGDAGIEVSIVQLEWSAFKQAVNDGDADAFWLSWQADYPDPENFLYPVFHSGNAGSAGNRARFSDAEFDRLITEAQSEPDPAKRDVLYRSAQTRAVQMAPWVFFWHKKDYVVHQPWVTGYRLYPISNADKGLGVALLIRQ